MTEILLTATLSLNSIKTHVRSCEWQIFSITYQALFSLIIFFVIVPGYEKMHLKMMSAEVISCM